MTIVADRPSTQTAESTRAKFNYVVDTGVPAVRYIDWPEMAHNAVEPVYRQHEMIVRNGRPVRDTFNIDTHGFVFVDHHTQVKDFTLEAQRKGVYDSEVQALIKRNRSRRWLKSKESACTKIKCSSILAACHQTRHRKLQHSKRRES